MLRTAARTAVSVFFLTLCASSASAQTPGPLLVVDAHSRGGACSDSRQASQVTVVTPLCSLGAAVSLAPAGSTVVVRGGEYPGLLIEGKRYGAPTTFKPFSANEPVQLAGVAIRDSSHIRIEGFRVRGSISTWENERLAIVGNETSPGNIESYANIDVLIEGNYVHDVPGFPHTKPEGYGIVLYTFERKQNIRPVVRKNFVERTGADPYHSVSSMEALFELNVGLDALPAPGSGTHVDALHAQGGRGLVIRHNRFDNIAHGLMFTDKDAQRVVIDNNLLTNIVKGYGINGAVGPGAQILSNTVLSRYGINLVDETEDTTSQLSGVVVRNNILDNKAGLGANPIADYNLWIRRNPAQTYSPHDVFGQPRWDAQYRLQPGSPGYRAGTPDNRDMGVLIDLWGPPPKLESPQPPPPAKRKKGRKGFRLVAKCVRGRLHLRLKGKRVRRARARAVRFSVDRWSLRPDSRRPFTRSVRVTAPTRVRVVIRLKRKKRPVVLVSTVPGCGAPR